MKDIYSYCQGESHKGNNKPCQDCAFSQSSASLSMAIVSDGHGGERYFRSQIGSKIVVDVIKESVVSFVKDLSKSTQKKSLGKALFADMPFVQYPSKDDTQLSISQKRQAELIHEALLRLFSNVIYRWNTEIARNAEQEPLTEWEKANVPQKYLDEFEAKRNDPTSSLEKFYGCTFMAYVQTKTYWFAFHLGDGKCVMFDTPDDKPRFSQPIPWDEKCFLNKTTSICDSNPLLEVRYCYCGNGSFPEAIFLGSDGIDDSFGDGERLYNFYIQIYQTLASKKKKGTQQELDASLPIISQKGSKDDMSVACVYNEHNLERNNTLLNKYQIEKIENQLQTVEHNFKELTAKIKGYSSIKKLSDKEQIECRYAEIDWRKNVELETQLYIKLAKLGVQKVQPTRILPGKEAEISVTQEEPKSEVPTSTEDTDSLNNETDTKEQASEINPTSDVTDTDSVVENSQDTETVQQNVSEIENQSSAENLESECNETQVEDLKVDDSENVEQNN